jgi:hypothetical protein
MPSSVSSQNTALCTWRPWEQIMHQALVMGFSDTFAVIGIVLVLAALALR